MLDQYVQVCFSVITQSPVVYTSAKIFPIFSILLIYIFSSPFRLLSLSLGQPQWPHKWSPGYSSLFVSLSPTPARQIFQKEKSDSIIHLLQTHHGFPFLTTKPKFLYGLILKFLTLTWRFL